MLGCVWHYYHFTLTMIILRLKVNIGLVIFWRPVQSATSLTLTLCLNKRKGIRNVTGDVLNFSKYLAQIWLDAKKQKKIRRKNFENHSDTFFAYFWFIFSIFSLYLDLRPCVWDGRQPDVEGVSDGHQMVVGRTSEERLMDVRRASDGRRTGVRRVSEGHWTGVGWVSDNTDME